MRVVVTGAAGGIGSRVAARLDSNEHTVVALDQKPADETELPETIEYHSIDLCDETAVSETLDDVEPAALVSAVGWYELASIEDCSPDTLRKHLEANLLAVHTPIHALLPTLRQRGGRLVVVGSMVGSVPLPYHGAYSTAKAGLNGYTASLRRELSEYDVDVSLIEPGPVETGFNERATRSLAGLSESAYAEQYREFESYSPGAASPDAVVETILRALQSDSPRARYRVSRRARWLPRLQSILPTALYDRLIRSGLPGGLLYRFVDR